MLKRLTICAVLVAMTPGARAAEDELLLVTDEADAVLTILAREAARQPVTPADWDRLWKSEGYKRLQKREAGMKRAFTDEDFRKFATDPKLLSRREALAKSLPRRRRPSSRTRWPTSFITSGSMERAHR